MRIVPVTPDEEEMLETSGGRRGRVAWGIIKEFEESGLDKARIELERSPVSTVQLLRAYIKSHGLNLRVSHRRGEIYLIKTENKEAKPLTPEVVDEH